MELPGFGWARRKPVTVQQSRRLAACCVLWLPLSLWAAAEGAGTAVSAADSTNPRGTERPLRAECSPLRQAGRAVLFLPYAGIRTVLWAPEQLAFFDARYELSSRMVALLTFRAGQYKTELGPFFSYESSTGLGLAGAAIGARDWFGSGADMKLKFSYVGSRRNYFSFGLEREASPFGWQLDGKIERRADHPFYGLGPQSSDDRFDADRDQATVEAGLRFTPHSGVEARLTGYFDDTELDDPEDADPVSTAFPTLWSRATDSQYVGLEAQFLLDGRNDGDFSSRGGALRLMGGVNDSRSASSASYEHYSAEAQYFVNLHDDTRVLALRAYGEALESRDWDGVPYTNLVRFGGSDGLRGYSRYRFADRQGLLVTAEYRYLLTTHWQGRIFTDWGSVAPKWKLMRLAQTDPIFGFALALESRRFPLLMQIARSPESTEFYVGTHSIFDLHSRRER